jgi:hypothetical protein
MKTKTFILSLLFAGVCVIRAESQTFSRQVLNNYSAPVAAKVYEIYANTLLNEEKQILLAEAFRLEDSLLFAAAQNNSPAATLLQIRHLKQSEVHSILSSDELNRYYASLVDVHSYAQANAAVNGVDENIGMDSILRKELFEIQYSKILELNILQQKNLYTPDIAQELVNIYRKHDSAYYKIIERCRQNVFIDKKLNLLESIKPLGEKRAVIKSEFFALSDKNSDVIYEAIFQDALLNKAYDTAYISGLYKNEINDKVVRTVSSDLYELQQKQKLPRDVNRNLKNELYKKGYELALLDYIKYSAPEKLKLTDSISNSYDMKVNNILYREGINTPNSQFFAILRNKKVLKLTKIQEDSLVKKGFELEANRQKSLLPNSPAFNIKQVEKEQICKILSEEQYTKFLSIKNKEKALFYAKNDWADILKYNLAQPSDSAKLFKGILQYQLARCVVTDRYNDDPARRMANHKVIDATMPSIISSLKSARTWSSKAGKENDNVPYRGTFQW